MKTTKFDAFVHKYSLMLIFLPLIIIMSAFLLEQPKIKPIQSNQPAYEISQENKAEMRTPEENNSITASIEAKKIDLVGPYSCNFSSATGTGSAQIKNNQILAKIRQNESNFMVLLNNDCLYYWETDKLEGKKTCGLSFVLSLLKGFNGSAGLDIGKEIGLENGFFDMKELFKNCQKEEIADAVFNVPVKIEFSEMGLNSLVDLGGELLK